MNRPIYMYFLLLILLSFIGCAYPDPVSPALDMDNIWQSNSQEYLDYLSKGGLTEKDALLILVDCSGSMSGQRLEKAKEALNKYLDTLGPNQTVYLYRLYHSTTFKYPDSQSIERLKKYINDLRADGGTPLGSALEILQADGVSLEGKFAHITCLVITDGQCNSTQQQQMEMAAVRMIRSRQFLDVIGYDMAENHSLSKYASRYRTADQASLVNVLLEKEE